MNRLWYHGLQLKVATVVAGLVNNKLTELAELNLEGVATADEQKRGVFQIVSCFRIIEEMRVLNEGLRTSIMDEHADA